jgi:hypothetical protein
VVLSGDRYADRFSIITRGSLPQVILNDATSARGGLAFSTRVMLPLEVRSTVQAMESDELTIWRAIAKTASRSHIFYLSPLETVSSRPTARAQG